RDAAHSSLTIAVLIILPQIIVALMAPWVGRQAKNWGRRPLLLIGFGALPIRALLFASVINGPLVVGFQVLDGISGAVLGVLTALVIADVTSGTAASTVANASVGRCLESGLRLATRS